MDNILKDDYSRAMFRAACAVTPFLLITRYTGPHSAGFYVTALIEAALVLSLVYRIIMQKKNRVAPQYNRRLSRFVSDMLALPYSLCLCGYVMLTFKAADYDSCMLAIAIGVIVGICEIITGCMSPEEPVRDNASAPSANKNAEALPVAEPVKVNEPVSREEE